MLKKISNLLLIQWIFLSQSTLRFINRCLKPKTPVRKDTEPPKYCIRLTTGTSSFQLNFYRILKSLSLRVNTKLFSRRSSLFHRLFTDRNLPNDPLSDAEHNVECKSISLLHLFNRAAKQINKSSQEANDSRRSLSFFEPDYILQGAAENRYS